MEAPTPPSPVAGAPGEPGEPGDEVAALRAQILALEDELAETHRRANAAIAAAQERVYWLDRWHVDLNELMLRRWAVATRALLRAVRSVVRPLRRFTRSLR